MNIKRVKQAAVEMLTRLVGDREGRILLPLLRGPTKGLWFRLDLRNDMAYLLGRYDRSVITRLARICQRGWTVWDCGTYLGYYTALFAKLVGPTGQVVAFEPDPRNMSMTRKHVVLNRFFNVQFVEAAISGEVGEVDFILSNNSNSHLPGTWVGETWSEYAKIERIDARRRVRGISLDWAYLHQHLPAPHLIKLDIEGAEATALRSASRLVREVRPLIVLELHNPESREAASWLADTMAYSLQSLLSGRTIEQPEPDEYTLLCRPMEHPMP